MNTAHRNELPRIIAQPSAIVEQKDIRVVRRSNSSRAIDNRVRRILLYGATTGTTPSAFCTVVHSKENGSGVCFGSAASSAFSRSARAVLMG